jgi:hypothetical protein
VRGYEKQRWRYFTAPRSRYVLVVSTLLLLFIDVFYSFNSFMLSNLLYCCFCIYSKRGGDSYKILWQYYSYHAIRCVCPSPFILTRRYFNIKVFPEMNFCSHHVYCRLTVFFVSLSNAGCL